MEKKNLAQLFEKDLCRRKKLFRKNSKDNFLHLQDLFQKANIDLPWPLRNEGSFFCFLEFDIKSYKDLEKFAIYYAPFKSVEAERFYALCHHLVGFLQSWNYMSEKEERKYFEMIERWRLFCERHSNS